LRSASGSLSNGSKDKLTDHDFSHAVPSARARGCWRVAVAAYGWLAHLLSRVSGFAAEFRLNSQEEQRTRENVMGRLISLLFVAIAACCAQAAHAAATEVENISDPTWQPYQVVPWRRMQPLKQLCRAAVSRVDDFRVCRNAYADACIAIIPRQRNAMPQLSGIPRELARLPAGSARRGLDAPTLRYYLVTT